MLVTSATSIEKTSQMMKRQTDSQLSRLGGRTLPACFLPHLAEGLGADGSFMKRLANSVSYDSYVTEPSQSLTSRASRLE